MFHLVHTLTRSEDTPGRDGNGEIPAKSLLSLEATPFLQDQDIVMQGFKMKALQNLFPEASSYLIHKPFSKKKANEKRQYLHRVGFQNEK